MQGGIRPGLGGHVSQTAVQASLVPSAGAAYLASSKSSICTIINTVLLLWQFEGCCNFLGCTQVSSIIAGSTPYLACWCCCVSCRFLVLCVRRSGPELEWMMYQQWSSGHLHASSSIANVVHASMVSAGACAANVVQPAWKPQVHALQTWCTPACYLQAHAQHSVTTASCESTADPCSSTNNSCMC